MIRLDGRDRALMAWIPARGGSKGLPRKALQDLGGRPVIAHTIEAALAVRGMDRVIVNTDDPEIAAAALEYGAEVPFLRPAELARDDSSLADVVQHMNVWLERNQGFSCELAVGMSPTHPFRRRGRIDQALDMAVKDPGIGNVRGMGRQAHDPDNYWLAANGSLAAVVFDRVPVRGGMLQNLFSFNLVLNCRYQETRGRVVDRIAPLELDLIESIDIDEPRDLDLARLILQQELFADGTAGNLAMRG
ncbi:MAG: acylneuraminate cytidylyltransferase family protein [Desulfovibrionaceae bacterium]|nr:acylneuraminate cytidylyltransferase family protein [Desulfovibrionaceae bacterium]